MTIELLLYALAAGGLVFWLKNTLGTRHGEERDRSQDYMNKLKERGNVLNDAAENDAGAAVQAPTDIDDQIKAYLNTTTGIASIETKIAENGLRDIIEFDRIFDLKFFFEATQDVFAIVVEAFGNAERETLQDLLAPNVYAAFEAAIDAREKTGETLENEIHAISRAEIIDAKLDKKTALITVRFVADETSVTRDKDGEILSGHPDKTTQMRDIWTFSRDLKSRDPRWFVSETRGDFDGDNETIPNTE